MGSISSHLCFLIALFPGCTSQEDFTLPPELLNADEEQAISQDWHMGPDVELGDTGPARFVSHLSSSFRAKRAMDTVRFTDRFYRAPANPAYDTVLDHVADQLRAAGFDGTDENLRLEILEQQVTAPAWTPKSASLVLIEHDMDPNVLHAFDKSEDVDRVMLPVNALPCDLEADVAMSLEDLEEGMILVTDASARQVMNRARGRGAVAVVSASLGIFNRDPSGQERHLDAVQFRTMPADPAKMLPVIQISPRSYRKIQAAHQQAAGSSHKVRLRVRAEVEVESRPLRTLVATVMGKDRPQEAVVLVSHIQEPGACDNASGVAGLLESVRALTESMAEGKIEHPSRSLVFIWGDEFRQSEIWLANTDQTAVAAFSSDMTGQSRETGAIALLERMPDPGALVTLPPDAHTPWGAGDVDEEDLRPNGLPIIARCAMIDVGVLEGGWETADHPWEGGSDHDVFIREGVPAVLFWHFTDFTYHTSLDRLEFVDQDEIRRTAVALLSSALAIADPQPGDLDRYLKSLSLEEQLRVATAEEASNPELVEQWKAWSLGARQWLRNQCLGIDEEIPEIEGR